MTATPIRAAVCREFGQPLSIEELHLAAPKSGQAQVRTLASAICHGGMSTIAIDIPELISKYRNGELLLDELISNTYTIDEINEAIESVKIGQAIRNVILFDHDELVGAN